MTDVPNGKAVQSMGSPIRQKAGREEQEAIDMLHTEWTLPALPIWADEVLILNI